MALDRSPCSPERVKPLTWRDTLRREPRLASVMALVKKLHPYSDDEGKEPFAWGVIKQMFLPLVGHEAEKYELRNSTCYDVAYDSLVSYFESGRPLRSRRVSTKRVA
ncbi:MAG: hypothetical protein ACLP9L_33405 [Thermoguttaceae bacterium]